MNDRVKKCIIFFMMIIPLAGARAVIKQDKIKAQSESKDGFSYLKLGDGDGLRNGSILVSSDGRGKPYFLEILGILGPHYSLFQRIEMVWNNNEKKITKNYLDKTALNGTLEISEIYDGFDQVLVSKLKEAESLYKNAIDNYDKKRINLSKKYFEECLDIITDYKDAGELLNSLLNDLANNRLKADMKKGVWEKAVEQVAKFKSEGNLAGALNVLKKLSLDYPLNKNVRNELGLLYNEMGYINFNNEYFTDAINEMEELLFIDPKADSIRNELAFLYYYQGDKDRAMEHFEKLFSSSKDDNSSQLRNMMNKMLFISSKQSDNSIKGTCGLCLNPIQGTGTAFPSGLIICDSCNEGQIREKQDVKTYFKKIENYFAERYKIKIRNIKDFIPNSEPELREISRAASDKETPSVFFKPAYTEYEIHYMAPMPRVLIIEGLISEYVRVWLEEQKLNCVNIQMDVERRGIEMYFKYVLLNHFLLREQLERFIYQNDPASLVFRRIKAIVETRGEGNLVDTIKKCFEQ